MRKKYLFFDIDGTLLCWKDRQTFLPESTKTALDLLRQKGTPMAIATGRSYAMARQVMEDLGFTEMVCDGGNGLVMNGRLLGIEPLDHDKCVALIHECIEKDFIWALSMNNETSRQAPDGRFAAFTDDTYMTTEIIPDLRPEDCENIYKVYIACDPGREAELKTLDALPWCRFGNDSYLFVEPADKGAGIRRMVDAWGGNDEDVIVFGDQKNDLSMFCEDFTCVAMGNAVDELKARADYVTTAVDDDGIYNACRHLGLI